MAGEHIITIGIWVFTIVLLIGFFITGTELEFLGYLILLFIAFVFSLMAEFLLDGKTKQ